MTDDAPEPSDLPAPTKEQVEAALLRKVGLHKPSRKGYAGLDTVVCKLTEAEFELAMSNPKIATAILARANAQFAIETVQMWAAVRDEAIEKKSMQAAKLFAQRFDPEYRERKESVKKHEFEFPSEEDFHHAMRLKYGERAWNAAQELAEESGERGGVFGEKFLPGGSAEEGEVIDAEFEDDEEISFD